MLDEYKTGDVVYVLPAGGYAMVINVVENIDGEKIYVTTIGQKYPDQLESADEHERRINGN